MEWNKQTPDLYYDNGLRALLEIDSIIYAVEYTQDGNSFFVLDVKEVENPWRKDASYTELEAHPFNGDDKALWKSLEDQLQELYYES